MQTFFSCEEEDCKKSRCLGVPELSFMLHVPCLAADRLALEGNLEALLLAEKVSEPLTCCKGAEKSERVHGSRCYRLARPPPTLVINLKRAVVRLMTDKLLPAAE